MYLNGEAPTFDTSTPATNPDDRLLVIFEDRVFKNEAESEKEGRPIYKSIEFITIKVPGSADTFESKLTKELKERFRVRYERWREKREALIVQGTPLEAWPELDRVLVHTYKELGILTVEQLANLNEQYLPKLGPGAIEKIKRAKTFLEFAKGSAEFAKVKESHEKLKDENQALKEQLAKLEKAVAELAMASATEKPKKKKKVESKEDANVG